MMILMSIQPGVVTQLTAVDALYSLSWSKDSRCVVEDISKSSDTFRHWPRDLLEPTWPAEKGSVVTCMKKLVVIKVHLLACSHEPRGAP
jgi:hypothetical protein